MAVEIMAPSFAVSACSCVTMAVLSLTVDLAAASSFAQSFQLAAAVPADAARLMRAPTTGVAGPPDPTTPGGDKDAGGRRASPPPPVPAPPPSALESVADL